VNDPYEVLDCALRSRYLALEDLPSAPVWDRLPAELRSALADALAAGQSLWAVVPLVWQVRARLLGKPLADRTGERTRLMVELRLGLMYLGYREGWMRAGELLTRALHVADSYVCSIDGRPFLQLRHELEAGGVDVPADARVTELFAPYTMLAEEYVEYWGLRVRRRTIRR
jgi:hypothetical protein